MNAISLFKVQRPLLFETALQNADTTLLRSLRDQAGTLDPRRRKLFEAELARREAVDMTWIVPIITQ